MSACNIAMIAYIVLSLAFIGYLIWRLERRR